MTFGDLTRTPATRAASALLAAAIVITGWTFVRAVRPAAMPAAAGVRIASLDPATRSAARETTDINAAVAGDLFAADRSAPSVPYRMPGENAPDQAVTVEPTKPVVLGTAVATDGRHFATVQLGDSRPTLVHVGDRIGEWIVRSIERGKVAFLSTGGIHADVTTPKPGT